MGRMLTRREASAVLRIPENSVGSVARAAMLSKLHDLVANQGLRPDSPQVKEVESAYEAFTSGSRSDPTPQPPSPGAPQHDAAIAPLAPMWSPRSPRFWVIILVLAFAGSIGISILVGMLSGGNGSNSRPQESRSTISAPPLPPPPSLDSGVTGEVGSCWAESPVGSNNYRRVDCGSTSADVWVAGETRNPDLCAREYFDIGGGWYLCLTNL